MANGTDFDRGQAAGEIAARMDGYDKHFQQINGSIADTAAAINGFSLVLQGLKDAVEADRNTAKALALALAEADKKSKDTVEEKRRLAEERWSPRVRMYALLGTIATIMIAVGSLYATFHH